MWSGEAMFMEDGNRYEINDSLHWVFYVESCTGFAVRSVSLSIIRPSQSSEDKFGASSQRLHKRGPIEQAITDGV